eukprot:1660476-Rhodomonas_salina.2
MAVGDRGPRRKLRPSGEALPLLRKLILSEGGPPLLEKLKPQASWQLTSNEGSSRMRWDCTHTPMSVCCRGCEGSVES